MVEGLLTDVLRVEVLSVLVHVVQPVVFGIQGMVDAFLRAQRRTH